MIRSHRSIASRAKYGRDVDAGERGAAVGVPDERPSAAAAEIDRPVGRTESEKRPQHVVAYLRTRGAAARSTRAADRRAGRRRGTWFARRLRSAAASRGRLRAREGSRTIGTAERVTVRHDPARAVGTPHGREQRRRDHPVEYKDLGGRFTVFVKRPPRSFDAPPRAPARASPRGPPTCTRGARARAASPKARASRSSAATRPSASASARGSPAVTSNAVVPSVSTSRAAPAGPTRRSAGRATGIRTASTATCSVRRSPSRCWAAPGYRRAARCSSTSCGGTRPVMVRRSPSQARGSGARRAPDPPRLDGRRRSARETCGTSASARTKTSTPFHG